jgi:rubrerythrin
MNQDKELIKALKYAIEFEIKGENIYEDLANEAEDEFVKNTFSGLAKDELVHIEVINKYMESIESETEFDFDKEMEKVKDVNPKRFFGMLTKGFKKKAALAAEKLKPFDTGIELENKSINYYTEQSKKAKSEMTKKLFEFLTKQEKFHLKSLQEAKDFLGDPENFYVEFERWTLEG